MKYGVMVSPAAATIAVYDRLIVTAAFSGVMSTRYEEPV